MKEGEHFLSLKVMGFPSGSVVENWPANAGDVGSIPDPGRSHMLQSNKAHGPQLFSLCSRAREPQLLKCPCLEPVLHNKRSHRNEKPVHRNWSVGPALYNQRKACLAAKTQHSQNKNN